MTHYIQLESFTNGDFAYGDIVTIHVKTTNAYGVTGGVDPLDTMKIERRVVAVDNTNKRISFDRPILKNFASPFVGKSVTGNTDGTFFAFVTKAKHIAFNLVMGSRGGVQARVYQPINFYEPKPIDDFESVYRATWDSIFGYQIADPHAFEVHFTAVSLPTPGGVIAA